MADDNLFSVQVVTPERVLINGVASQVILRTADGDITFLAGHTPLVGAVEPGVVRVVAESGDEERVAAHGGFVQVEQHVATDGMVESAAASSALSGTRVTVLAGIAELAVEIDVERARVALDAAESRVADLAASSGGRGGSGGATAGSGEGDEVDVELPEAEAALRRAQVRLEAAGVTAGANA